MSPRWQQIPTVCPVRVWTSDFRLLFGRLRVTFARFGLATALAIAMADTNDLETLQDQLEAEKRTTEALKAQYKKAVQELRAALQREAQLQAEKNSPTLE